MKVSQVFEKIQLETRKELLSQIEEFNFDVLYIGLPKEGNSNCLMFINHDSIDLLDLVSKSFNCIIIHNRIELGNKLIGTNWLFYHKNPRYIIAQCIQEGINRTYGIDYSNLMTCYSSSQNMSIENTKLGKNVVFSRNCIIGCSDFCVLPTDKKGENIMMPQIGIVEIGNNVYVGPNSSIGRGTFGATKIGNYTRIDSNCWIGHNSTIGNNVIITTGVILAGSVTIEDNVFIGIGARINEGIHIGKGAIIASGSVITKDVPANTLVGGIPAKILKEQVYFDLIDFKVKHI